MRFVVVLLAVVIVVSGCTRPTKDELWQGAVEAQKRGDFDESIEAYERLLEAYPKSDRAPEAMYAIGTIYQSHKGEPNKAIEAYRRLVKEFPAHATAPSAAFLIGFIYNNDLKNIDSARLAYQDFLAKYPDNSMAASARFELSTLGKDAGDILKEQVDKQAAADLKPAGKKSRR